MSSQSVRQSGAITPGHIAQWTTDGVLQDGGVIQQGNTILARLLSADFNSVADQAIQFPLDITAFSISGIIITNASLSLTTAVGGFYPTTSKGGTAIVANTQVYSSLTTSQKLLAATLAAGVSTTRYSSLNVDAINGYLTLYLSLTTAQGASSTADCYVLGNNLSI
jgi:hypothetical protein